MSLPYQRRERPCCLSGRSGGVRLHVEPSGQNVVISLDAEEGVMYCKEPTYALSKAKIENAKYTIPSLLGGGSVVTMGLHSEGEMGWQDAFLGLSRAKQSQCPRG